MLQLIFILALHASSLNAQTAVVAPEIFTIGKQWSWIYSSLEKSGEWTPYFLETYTVVAREGTKVTVEMSSHPTSQAGPTAPHHKFIADLAACARAGQDPARQGWTVEFYTKSLGSGWQLVSRTHPNLVFTEKFNCVRDFAGRGVASDQFAWNGTPQAIFQITPKPRQDASWYFLDLPGFEGVTARKVFQPNSNYKLELIP